MNTAQVLRPLPIVASTGRTRDQQLSELIGVIYDAAIDPSLWEYAIRLLWGEMFAASRSRLTAMGSGCCGCGGAAIPATGIRPMRIALAVL